MRKLRRRITVLVGLFVAFEIFMTIAYRLKTPALLDPIKRFNRDFLNPIMLDYAGRHGFYASAIHHMGRKTRTPYSTPVYATATPDGYVIPLPYGTDVEWLKNVMADDHARLDYDGVSHRVEAAEIVPASVAEPFLPARIRNRMRFYRVEKYLQLKSA